MLRTKIFKANFYETSFCFYPVYPVNPVNISLTFTASCKKIIVRLSIVDEFVFLSGFNPVKEIQKRSHWAS